MFFATRVEPPPTSTPFRACAEAFLAGRVREAAELSSTHVVDAPDALLCVDVLTATGRPRRALAMVRRAVRLFPGHGLVLLEAARASLLLGKAAEGLLDRVAGDVVTGLRVTALRAWAAAARGDDDDAARLAARAAESGDAIVEHDLGMAAAARAELDDALAHFEAGGWRRGSRARGSRSATRCWRRGGSTTRSACWRRCRRAATRTPTSTSPAWRWR